MAEFVAGRNAVLEALRAAVPTVALHVGPRLDADERINEAIKLAADLGVPVVGMESPRGIADPALGTFADVLAMADVVLLLGKKLGAIFRV